VAVGAISGLVGIDPGYVSKAIRKQFRSKDPQIVEGNLKAAKAGYEFAQGMAARSKIHPIQPDKRVKE